MLPVLAVLVALGQQPAMTPEPAWYWMDIFGQRVQVYGVQLADGRISWHPEDTTHVAPVEMERRGAAQPGAIPGASNAPAASGTPNYGILVNALAGDSREIRASDPETLRMVEEAVGERRPRCPDDPDTPERKPGVVERAEIEVERIALYLFCGFLLVVTFVVVVRSKNNQP